MFGIEKNHPNHKGNTQQNITVAQNCKPGFGFNFIHGFYLLVVGYFGFNVGL